MAGPDILKPHGSRAGGYDTKLPNMILPPEAQHENGVVFLQPFADDQRRLCRFNCGREISADRTGSQTIPNLPRPVLDGNKHPPAPAALRRKNSSLESDGSATNASESSGTRLISCANDRADSSTLGGDPPFPQRTGSVSRPALKSVVMLKRPRSQSHHSFTIGSILGVIRKI
jgi:hypothetical protein